MFKDGWKWQRYTNMTDTTKDTIFYVGEYKKPLDEKRRLTVPSKWRFINDDADNAYIAVPNTNSSISIYPSTKIEDIKQSVAKVAMSNAQKQVLLQKFFRKVESLGCDKQGRLLLTEKLMHHGAIEREVTMVGVIDHFTIWNPEKFTSSTIESDDYTAEELAALEELGI